MYAGNPAPLGELNATDGSEVLFKMYLEMAGDEDKEMAERWRADAKGTIIFVSLEITLRSTSHVNLNVVDWSVLCCSRCTPLRVGPGPPTKLNGYLSILSCKYLPVAC
jgi:hypothetical protein